MKGSLVILATTWLVFAGLGYIVGYVSLRQESMQFLANHGASVKGRVEAKMPDQHRTVVYTYLVDGVRYTGVGSANYEGKDFDNVAVGDEVVVVYDPDSPLASFPGDPRPVVRQNDSTILTLAVIVPIIPMIIVGLVLFALRNRKMRSLE